ncbi:MAG: 50S ribosomal protein L19 [Phycisphaeraceae bacterium]|nr:50S ribosomal protein L19 [Phycisphaeraceae bacterium]
MSQNILKQVEAKQLQDRVDVSTGDTVDVHYRIIEGNKERIQVFTGVIIAIKGSGINTNITVRRIVANEGVERIFPLHSPKIAKIEIKRHAHTRRSKLYFLRDRIGKARRLPDRRRGLKHAVMTKVTKTSDETPVDPAQQKLEAQVEAAEAKASEEKAEAGE